MRPEKSSHSESLSLKEVLIFRSLQTQTVHTCNTKCYIYASEYQYKMIFRVMPLFTNGSYLQHKLFYLYIGILI